MTRLLFVCLGNIIRSPLAENLFRFEADRAGVGAAYVVDSAGTAAWHIGEPPDPRMRKTAQLRGHTYSGSARQVRSSEFEEFDWIIAMDGTNRQDLMGIADSEEHRTKIRLLREFDPLADDLDVPDPYYEGAQGFEATYEIVERSVRGLLKALESNSM